MPTRRIIVSSSPVRTQKESELDLAIKVGEAVDEASQNGASWEFIITYLRVLAEEIEQETAS